jgi:protein-tyrosine phosphatase
MDILHPAPPASPFPVDLLWVGPADLPGRLAMGFAPGRMAGRWETRDLEVDLRSLRRDHGLVHLVCLLEDHELELLGIPDLLPRAEAEGLKALHAPLPDGGTPSSPEAMETLVQRILSWLEVGEGVFLHCWAGMGRTGTVASACLIARGFSAAEAMERVRKARPGAVETPAQERFLRGYAQWRTRVTPGVAP